MLRDWQFSQHYRAKDWQGQSSSSLDSIKITDKQIAVCFLSEAPGWLWPGQFSGQGVSDQQVGGGWGTGERAQEQAGGRVLSS